MHQNRHFQITPGSNVFWVCITVVVCFCLRGEHSHGGEGVQGGEGSRDDRGDSVIIERQQTYRAEAREGGVVHTGDLVAPQHPVGTHPHPPWGQS